MRVGRHTYGHEQIAPYAIVGGNPARLLRHRFDAGTVARLLAIRWWDWSDERIAESIELLCSGDVERFVRVNGGAPPPGRPWRRLLGSER